MVLVTGRWFVKAAWWLCRLVGRLLRRLLRALVSVIQCAARLGLRVVTAVATACAVGVGRVREAMQHRNLVAYCGRFRREVYEHDNHG